MVAGAGDFGFFDRSSSNHCSEVASVTDKRQVGFIGVGLMGHGIARNLLGKGFALDFLNHPGNRPVDDLLALGARGLDSATALAGRADVVFLCVTGSPQVEAVVLGAEGILPGLGPGKILVDCSTARPESTLRVAAAVAGTGARFLDAPMTRTPKEAEEGRLNLMVGGDAATLAEVRPMLEAFAENIYHAGPVSAGHRLKLLHNFVSLGNSVLLAEAVTCARAGGIDMPTFVDVLASGGGDSVILKRLSPYILDGDDSGFRFSLANSRKDMGYYTAMADELDAPAFAAHAVQQVYALACTMGKGAEPVPELIDVLQALRR